MILRICPRHPHVRYQRGAKCPLCIPHDRGGEWHRTRERVLARDGHRCTFYTGAPIGGPLTAGHRCEETTRLEVAHLDSRADGGSDTDESRLVTLCHAHHTALDYTTGARG